jgi:hypothetical protein
MTLGQQSKVVAQAESGRTGVCHSISEWPLKRMWEHAKASTMLKLNWTLHTETEQV